VSALQARVVSTSADFDALEADWSRLHDASGESVFQSYEWQRAWWRHLGEKDRARSLHVVVLTEGPELVAIAPLCLARVGIAPGVRLRRLEFLGAGLSDYLGVLVRQGHEEAAAEGLAAHLWSDVAFDVLALTDLTDESPSRAPLFAALGRYFEGAPFVAEQCPRAVLKATVSETLSAVPGPQRRTILANRRYLEAVLPVCLEFTRAEDTLAADVQDLMELHQTRWTGAARKGIYADEAVAAFQQEVARLFFRRGWLFLPFLRAGGTRVATYCGLLFRGSVSVYLTGMREVVVAGKKYAPGIVLHLMCMEEMIGRGVGVYDFLRGIEPYKYRLGGRDVPQWSVLMFRKGARIAKAKNVLALLEASAARRREQEWLAVQRLREAHGLFSATVARYLWGRLSATLRDGARKLRAPEKSLTAPR